jgi:pullulanase/glycogen debranching enzyme
VPEALRGTYAGLAHAARWPTCSSLGVTAVSCCRCTTRPRRGAPVKLGLVNYWGYNTLGWFCPDPRLASGVDGHSPRDEFRQMVRRLHEAGLEVILDVVFNHSAETDEHRPAAELRGLDNAWYRPRRRRVGPRLREPQRLRQHPGHPPAAGAAAGDGQPALLGARLCMWTASASTSHRCWGGAITVSIERAAFFQALAQDPVLSRVKLIAEPWDLGPGGYQLGHFPRGWLEWNDRFRDTMRGFWLHMGQGGAGPRGPSSRSGCAARPTIFRAAPGLPAESVNFVVAHDGFTLHDLVSYHQRHNEANGEHNRDGHGHNLSFNCGVEGPSDDPTVLALRGRLQRALLACTAAGPGHADAGRRHELGHSQQRQQQPLLPGQRDQLDQLGAGRRHAAALHGSAA